MTQQNQPNPKATNSYEQAGRAAMQNAKRAQRSMVSWFEGVMPGHGNAIFFGLVGLVVAIVILCLGFWAALLVAILVVAGVAFGQWLDGTPTIVDMFKRLFRG